MATSINAVQEAFELLFEGMSDPNFSKSHNLDCWNERDLLPLVRTFLLGYFGKSVAPEVTATLPGSKTGTGRIDFIIDDVAVEFAVRSKYANASNIKKTTNESEVKKLLKFDGKSLLVLFDFSSDPMPEEVLHDFRELPSLGRGNHKTSPFRISHLYLDDFKEVQHVKKVIRTC